MSTFGSSAHPAIPDDFAAEAMEAKTAGDAAKLMLLQLEVEGLPWCEPGSALVGASLGEMERTERRESPDRLILFTGHRIDTANRKTPRFPPEAESTARAAIDEVLKTQIAAAQGPLLGVAGGANGGDILFLEACLQLGIPIKMLLALPAGKFIQASVEAESGGWVSRFERLLERDQETPVLAQSKRLPSWLAAKPDYDIWKRNNLWLVAYALVHKPAHFYSDGAVGWHR